MKSYQSVFRKEIADCIKVRELSGFDCRSLITTFHHLDHYLTKNNIVDKIINEELVLDLFKSLSVKPITQNCYRKDLAHFAKYLKSLGFEATIPEKSKYQFDYTPYIFTRDEWDKMIAAADNLIIPRRPKSSIKMPVFLRLLYACGLRVNEALNILAEDVDIENGVLLIRVAKKRKQRFVPMDKSLTSICKEYIHYLNLHTTDYLFQKNDGTKETASWAHNCFKHILKNADIDFCRTVVHQRGPCMHCLRHTFVLRSLQKSQENGRIFYDTVPFLSTYLGHDSIRETDKYLNFSYELYETAASQLNIYTNDLFPKVVVK
jgi:integrase